MKRLSDYKGEKAIDLWADLIELAAEIMTDEEVQSAFLEPKIVLAKVMLRRHPKEVYKIIKRIDNSPVDGLNILVRLVHLLNEFTENEELKAFFGLQSQSEIEGYSGSAMENTEANEK